MRRTRRVRGFDTALVRSSLIKERVRFHKRFWVETAARKGALTPGVS